MSLHKPAKATIARALQIKAARQYIIAHPGCTEKEIQDATGCWTERIWHLLHLKLVRREDSLYYPVAAPDVPVE